MSLIGTVLGGSLIATLGSISTISIEKKQPTIKSISRDFIIGAILFMFIMYLLPESTTNLINTITSLFTLSVMKSASATNGGSISDDLEIQVGVPKF